MTTASCASRATSSARNSSGRNSQPSRLKSSICCWDSLMASSLFDLQPICRKFTATGRASRGLRQLEFATQLLERGVDPGAVHGTSGLQVGQGLVLGLLLGGGGLVDLLDLVEGNAQQAVAIADDEIAGLDHHAVERDRPADFAGTGLIRAAMGDAGRIDRKTQGAQRVGIPDRAVDHDTRETALGGTP